MATASAKACLFLLLGDALASDVAPSPPPRVKPTWQGKLNTYSIASVARREGRGDWNEITQGNKIVLPRKVLDYLQDRGLPYDKFQLLNPNAEKDSRIRLFTGPLDFCAADGECYLPTWVMKQLGIKAGEPCAVATACFPDCAFVKFQPHTSDFLDITDHYVVLTRTLEQMGGLTMGASIRVTDGKRTYLLDVLEVRGKSTSNVRDDSNGRGVAIGLMECPIEFDEPKDLVKKKPKKATAEEGGADGGTDAAAAAADTATVSSSSSSAGSSASSNAAGGSRRPAVGARRGRSPPAPSAEELDPDRWTVGPDDAAERVRALAFWGPIIPTGWDPDQPAPVPKFYARREAEARGEVPADVASPFSGKARTLGGSGGESESAEPKTEVAKARAAAKAAKEAKEAAAAAAAEAEAAATAAAIPPSHPAVAVAMQLLAALQALLAAVIKLLRTLLSPADVSFD